MTTLSELQALSDEQIIEKLAVEVMGWEPSKVTTPGLAKYSTECGCENATWIAWNPLTDWGHWRQVEEKVMEDSELWKDYIHAICNVKFDGRIAVVKQYMKADLPTRARALLSALSAVHE